MTKCRHKSNTILNRILHKVTSQFQIVAVDYVVPFTCLALATASSKAGFCTPDPPFFASIFYNFERPRSREKKSESGLWKAKTDNAIMNRPMLHSFILAISIAPLPVLYCSEALPTTARILYRRQL